MPTNVENIAQIRRLLDDPSPQSPDNAKLFEFLGNQVLHHTSQLQNSSAAWSVDDWQFSTSEGDEDYLVTAENFGKPFLCYTEDTSDPHLPRVEIPFAKLQNVDQFYSGPRQIYSTGSNIFTASVFSFYRKPEGWYVRIAPVPGGSATYVVWFETAMIAPSSLGDTPGLTPFHHLIRVQAALASLPYCAWGNLHAGALEPRQAAAWERKAKALGIALAKQEQDFQFQFSTYLGTLMEAGVEPRQGFGDSYLESTDWSWGIGSFGPNQWG